MSSAEQTGYFAPDSVTRRVLRDPAAGVGGVRALALQALHPRALAGVDQHSEMGRGRAAGAAAVSAVSLRP